MMDHRHALVDRPPEPPHKGRCAVCDCLLAGALTPCPDCGAPMHRPCRAYAGGCPLCGHRDDGIPVASMDRRIRVLSGLWLTVHRLMQCGALLASLVVLYCLASSIGVAFPGLFDGLIAWAADENFIDVSVVLTWGLWAAAGLGGAVLTVLERLEARALAREPRRLRPSPARPASPSTIDRVVTGLLDAHLNLAAMATWLAPLVMVGCARHSFYVVDPRAWFGPSFVLALIHAGVVTLNRIRSEAAAELRNRAARILDVPENPSLALAAAVRQALLAPMQPLPLSTLPVGRCPVCGDGFHEGRTVACPSCATPHHEDCWTYAGGCAIFACASAPRSPRSSLPSLVPSSLLPSLPSAATRRLRRTLLTHAAGSWCLATAATGSVTALWATLLAGAPPAPGHVRSLILLSPLVTDLALTAGLVVLGALAALALVLRRCPLPGEEPVGRPALLPAVPPLLALTTLAAVLLPALTSALAGLSPLPPLYGSDALLVLVVGLLLSALLHGAIRVRHSTEPVPTLPLLRSRRRA